MSRNWVGTGPGGSLDPAVDDWTPVQGEQVRQDLLDDDTRLIDHESRIDALETATHLTVRVATTANITIATALNNGDSLDGVTLSTGNLVLVKNQSAPEQNGIYVVGVSPGRSPKFDTYDEHPGAFITVQEGTSNADTMWLCTSNVGGTLNTTAIAFTQITSGSGITQLTSDVTAGPGTGSQAATIANNAVTNAKAADMAQSTIKGRAAAAGTGDPTDLTANEVSTILDSATDPFLRTSSGGGGGITQLTSDVTAGPGSGSQAATIANDAVSNTKMANMAQSTIKGRAAGAGTGDPADLTADQTATILGGTNVGKREFIFIIDGGGSTITTGDKDGEWMAPVAGVITRVTLLSSDSGHTSGSIVIGLRKDTYSNFPANSSDSIVASAPPTISSAIKSQDSTLTGWTTSFSAGDIFNITVTSVTSLKHVTMIVEYTPS